MTTRSNTTSPPTSMILLGKSFAAKLDWRCCRMVSESFPVVSKRSGRTKSKTMNTAMEEGSRKLGGPKDSTQKNETLLLSISSKKVFLKATTVLKSLPAYSRFGIIYTCTHPTHMHTDTYIQGT